MKNKLPLLILLILGILLSTCSMFDNENSEAVVSSVIEGNELIIRNGLDFDIYYFAVAQSALPYIFWVPLVEEFNRIPTNTVKVIPTESLYDVEKPMVVFYWDEEVSEIFSIVID